MIRAFLVDDEALAVKRLTHLLEETGRVTVVGSCTDPVDALAAIEEAEIDVLFLDIQMPVMNGFELLGKLESEPFVIFTTAYDKYALQAFEVNSVDYLVKPVSEDQLSRALQKLERVLKGSNDEPPRGEAFQAVVQELARALNADPGSRPKQTAFMARIASKIGDRVQFVPLEQVTHFFAEDKLTFASTPQKDYVVDHTVAELERKLNPEQFFRIHRSTIVNLQFLHELDSWFAGKALVRLKDGKGTELTVARDRVKQLREKLGV